MANEARQQNIDISKVKVARKWFRDKAQQIQAVNINDILRQNENRLRQSSKLGASLIGRMCCYYYDPKWKKELPYYDRFPVGFPIEYKKDRVLFLNLHYLPPKERASLMNGLYTVQTKNSKNEMKQLALSYGFLKGRQYSLGAYLPCIKYHLFSHLRSKPLVIHPDEWDFMCMLPMARFEKASEDKVWAESLRKLGK